MKLACRYLLVAVVASAACLSFCGAAGAANVAIGPILSGSWESLECGEPVCINFDAELGGTGSSVTSPVSGAVVGFDVVGGATGGTYKLRTLIPAKEAASIALFRKASAPVAVVPNAGIQHYATVLPIAMGEGVGLVQSETASIGFRKSVGRVAEWLTEPAENTSAGGSSEIGLAGFNIEVQPAPTITSLGAASGPIAGGTAVPIAGTDFVNVTGVAFGGTPAASFSVTSEGALTAVAPARATAGAVPVKVTTIAGSASAPQTFTYEAPPAPPAPPVVVQQCLVPNLKGKNLKAAKTALENAKCKLGKVTKLGGATAKSGKVTKQGAKAGAKVVVGTKVAVTLKPPKVTPKKGGKK